jgi:hypothetical protein
MITEKLNAFDSNPFEIILAEMKQAKNEYEQKMIVLQSRLQQAVQGAILLYQNIPAEPDSNK